VGGGRVLIGASALWVGLSAIYDGAHLVLLPALITPHLPPTFMATGLGLASFALLAAAALTQPLFGAWSDRIRPQYGRLRFALPALLGAVAALALVGTADTLPFIVAGLVVLYVCGSAVQAAAQALLPELFSRQQRGAAAGAKQFADLVGASISLALLGALVRTSVGLALAATAGMLLLSFATSAALTRERGTADSPGAAAPRVGSLRELIVIRFTFLFATYAIGRFLVLLVGQRLGENATAAASTSGQLLAVLTLITGLAAIPAGMLADRYGRRRVARSGSAIALLGACALGFASDTVGFLLAGGLLALGSAAFASANWAATADAAATQRPARALALANVATWGAAACAGLLGPLIDVGNAFANAGFILLLAVAAACYAGCVIALRPRAPMTSEALPIAT